MDKLFIYYECIIKPKIGFVTVKKIIVKKIISGIFYLFTLGLIETVLGAPVRAAVRSRHSSQAEIRHHHDVICSTVTECDVTAAVGDTRRGGVPGPPAPSHALSGGKFFL